MMAAPESRRAVEGALPYFEAFVVAKATQWGLKRYSSLVLPQDAISAEFEFRLSTAVHCCVFRHMYNFISFFNLKESGSK